MERKEISRRKFLKGAAAGAVGAAAMTMLGANVFASGEPGGASGGPGGPGGSNEPINENHLIRSVSDWKVAPKPIAESKITETMEADVLVIGGGYGGSAAALELTEEGYKVIVVESMAESGFSLRGGDQGVINSKYVMENYDMPYIDPIEFYNNWMANTNNYINPELIMKFAQHSGESFDWHISRLNETQLKQAYAKNALTEPRPHLMEGIGNLKYWLPTIQPPQATVNLVNRTWCIEQGARWLFGCHAEQLTTDGDTVTGAVIYRNEEETYFRVKAKYVVIATGGFGSNDQMMRDLLPDLIAEMQEQDTLAQMGAGRDGSGIAMATWVGGQYEHAAIPTMDGRQPWLGGTPGLTANPGYPQGIFLDWKGKRFMNEFYGTLEHRTFPMLHMDRRRMYCVYDDDLTETMQWYVPSHGTVEPSEATLKSVRKKMDEAYAARGALTDIGSGEMGGMGLKVYAGDTVEECLSYIPDLDDRVRANIIASVESYNKMCDAGRDDEFAREPALMFPLRKGPFYVQVVDGEATMGNLMVTMGGLWTDGEQRVLGPDWQPIHGLFATGNTTSGRFGREYFSPLYGVSIGMAICLGRECGISVGKQLRGEIFYQ